MKMKKVLAATLTVILLVSIAIPTYARNYSFESGANTSSTFGRTTSTDNLVSPNPETANIRRDKNATYSPPAYGIFSGELATNLSSPYHSNHGSIFDTGSFGSANMQNSSITNINVSTSNSNADFSANTSINNIGNTSNTINLPEGMLPSTSISTYNATTMNTVAWAYEDGSIGTLHIPKIDKTIKVFEGESLENMKKGIGTFESTSAWDGRVGLAGHNRGAAAYFGFVKDLNIGDKINYTTQYGTRTYEIFQKEKISETDYSTLAWTAENTITMITCVENQAELRWSVQAREAF